MGSRKAEAEAPYNQTCNAGGHGEEKTNKEKEKDIEEEEDEENCEIDEFQLIDSCGLCLDWKIYRL